MITESQDGNEASRYAARQWYYCDITEKHPHFQVNRWLSAVIKKSVLVLVEGVKLFAYFRKG
jgi:hypothetical protein